jgi:2-polyprenyl-3-methyl-5-hydroxy-6-metoxy-1,4-benzoquinol methylase
MTTGERRATAITDYSRTTWARHALELGESRLRKAFRLIAGERPGRLLDIGCGRGEFGALLIARGWTVTGIDLEPAQIAEARRLGVDARVQDLTESLGVADREFDGVFAGEIIEHLIDTDFLIAEIHRVLEPGGFVVLTTPNLASLENRMRLLFGIYPIWVDYRLEGAGHVRAYTPQALKRQLREHGFVIERHVGNWVPFVPQRWLDDRKAPWLASTGDWFPNLAMDIILKARKPR